MGVKLDAITVNSSCQFIKIKDTDKRLKEKFAENKAMIRIYQENCIIESYDEIF